MQKLVYPLGSRKREKCDCQGNCKRVGVETRSIIKYNIYPHALAASSVHHYNNGRGNVCCWNGVFLLSSKLRPQFSWYECKLLFYLRHKNIGFLQASESMKAVMQAIWLLTIAFGNLIVIVITKAKVVTKQVRDGHDNQRAFLLLPF